MYYNKKLKSGGFSLIEMSIVIIISGILAVAAFSSFDQYNEKKKIYETQAKIDTVTTALNRFFASYKRFPCPASQSAAIGDTNFGVATNCLDESQGVGCNADYCVSIRQIDHDDNPLTPMVSRRVRHGVLPLKTLQEGIDNTVTGVEATALFSKYNKTAAIGAEDIIDTYKNQLTYAVTEYQARDEYIPQLGGIEIINEHGNVLASNADYVLVSHGRNGGGARSLQGTQIANGCEAALPDNEEENCNGDNTYISSIRYDAVGADQFDDMLTYNSWMHYYLWDQASDDRSNIYNLNAGSVGINTKTPQEKLHVAEGNVLLDQTASDAVGEISSLMAKEYCSFDGTNVEGCFDPDLIGGAGLECSNPMEVMYGIQNGEAQCINLFADAGGNPQNQDIDCPAGQFLHGLTYNVASRSLTPLCRTP